MLLFIMNLFIGVKLWVKFLRGCSCVFDARKAFDKVPHPNLPIFLH